MRRSSALSATRLPGMPEELPAANRVPETGGAVPGPERPGNRRVAELDTDPPRFGGPPARRSAARSPLPRHKFAGHRRQRRAAGRLGSTPGREALRGGRAGASRSPVFRSISGPLDLDPQAAVRRFAGRRARIEARPGVPARSSAARGGVHGPRRGRRTRWSYPSAGWPLCAPSGPKPHQRGIHLRQGHDAACVGPR